MTKKQPPTITVVIATFNAKNTIGECLDSIAKQAYPSEED